MTREVAISRIKAVESFAIRTAIDFDKRDYEAFDMAIEALEQETVSKEVYNHEYFLRKKFELKIDELQNQLEEQAVKAESILDKIRAEIESITPKAHIRTGKLSIDTELMIPLDRVLKVIDKYKTESEEVWKIEK